MDTVFFVLEIIGLVAFAWSGAIVARKKEMDLFGVCMMGVTTALGGGLVRDVILMRMPTALTTPLYALIAAGVALFACLPVVQKLIEHTRAFNMILLLSDALGLGIFTVIGINICADTIPDSTIYMQLFMGVVTGVGGGALRDIFCNKTPDIFTKKFYACASLVGALAYSLLLLCCNPLVSAAIAIVLILTLRILAAAFHWSLPHAKALQFDNADTPFPHAPHAKTRTKSEPFIKHDPSSEQADRIEPSGKD